MWKLRDTMKSTSMPISGKVPSHTVFEKAESQKWRTPSPLRFTRTCKADAVVAVASNLMASRRYAASCPHLRDDLSDTLSARPQLERLKLGQTRRCPTARRWRSTLLRQNVKFCPPCACFFKPKFFFLRQTCHAACRIGGAQNFSSSLDAPASLSFTPACH